MELTTNYQMLNQAYLGNSYGELYVRIYAKYSERDEDNNRTKVQYQARAYYSGNTYIADIGGNGNVNGTSASQVSGSCTNVPSGEYTFATTEAWVEHNEDGTKSISASAYLNMPNWGWNNTASGTATLPPYDIGILRIGVNGEYKKAKAYLGVNGSWKKCKVYLGVNNTWKKGV